MFPFTVTPLLTPIRYSCEPDCCSMFPLTVASLRMHVASSGTTMFPKVPPTMGLGLLQTKPPALASDAINAPTDTDNAAHIDSVSIRRMETLPFLAPWLDSRIGRVLAQRSS